MITNKLTLAMMIIIIFLVSGLGLCSFYAILTDPIVPKAEINDLESIWGIIVPAGATEINFQSDVESSYIGLSFNIIPDHLDTFVESVCDGKLYKGYNPFNAIDSAIPTHNAVLIKMKRFTYYSSSSEDSTLIFGNRCNPTPGEASQVHQIAVDKTNPNLFSVRFEQPAGGCSANMPTCQSMGINYVNPIQDFPLMIVGLQKIEDGYQVIHREICFDTILTYVDISSWRREWENLIGATVQIDVDSIPFPQGTISLQGRLIPTELLVIGNIEIQNDSYWHYCVKNEWESITTHQISISISAANMKIIEKIVEFN